jgi:hypothetical protein
VPPGGFFGTLLDLAVDLLPHATAALTTTERPLGEEILVFQAHVMYPEGA